MVKLKIQPKVVDFVEGEYGKKGLKVLKKATEKLNKEIRWMSNSSEVGRRMDGSFKITGAHIFKKYVTGPQESWRMAIKQIDKETYAVEMFAKKKDEDMLIRRLKREFQT